MWTATILFVLTYVLVITDRINRSIIAMISGIVSVTRGSNEGGRLPSPCISSR